MDKGGSLPWRVGELPPQLAALNQTNVTVQTLAVEAGLTGDPEHIVHAIALYPLTSACCTLKEVRDMTAEMLNAEARWLPQFKGKRLKPTPVISIPKKLKRVDVPVDPALAIASRFGELARRNVKK